MAVTQPETSRTRTASAPSAGGGTAGPRLGRTWSLSPRSQPPDRENEPLLSAAPRPLWGPLLRQPWESHRGLVSPGVKSRPRGAHAASRLPPRSLRLAGVTGAGPRGEARWDPGRPAPRPGGGPGAVTPPPRRVHRDADTHTRSVCCSPQTSAPSASPVSSGRRFSPACESVSVHAPAAAPPLLTLTGR